MQAGVTNSIEIIMLKREFSRGNPVQLSNGEYIKRSYMHIEIIERNIKGLLNMH